MSDISPPSGLRPKVKFFAEVGENMINVDAAVEMLMTTDTPQANALRRVFRRKLAEWRTNTDLSPEKQREEALFATFDAVGVVVNDMGKLGGSMDD